MHHDGLTPADTPSRGFALPRRFRRVPCHARHACGVGCDRTRVRAGADSVRRHHHSRGLHAAAHPGCGRPLADHAGLAHRDGAGGRIPAQHQGEDGPCLSPRPRLQRDADHWRLRAPRHRAPRARLRRRRASCDVCDGKRRVGLARAVRGGGRRHRLDERVATRGPGARASSRHAQRHARVVVARDGFEQLGVGPADRRLSDAHGRRQLHPGLPSQSQHVEPDRDRRIAHPHCARL